MNLKFERETDLLLCFTFFVLNFSLIFFYFLQLKQLETELGKIEKAITSFKMAE